MRALSGGEVDANFPSVEIDAVAFVPGFAGVDEVIEGDESEAATSTGNPIVDQSDVTNAAVAREDGLHVTLAGRRIQIEDAQTLVFWRRFVSAEAGTASGGGGEIRR